MEFKEILISLRVKKGWKQYELADKLGISRQAISKWEVGLCKPDLDNFIKLASLFNVSLDYLAGNNLNRYLIKHEKNKIKLNFRNFIFLLFIFIIILYSTFKFFILFNIINA